MNFRRIEHSDLKDILLLTNDAFGKDYLNIKQLSTYISDENHFGYCLIDGANFVGFISLKLLTNNILQNYFLAEKDFLFKHFKSQASIAFIEQVVISPLYRNKGFSTLLLNNALAKTKCDTIACVCWIKDEPNLMKRLLLRNNFSLIKTIPRYWRTDSLLKKYNCALCGEPPCFCNAEVYELKKP